MPFPITPDWLGALLGLGGPAPFDTSLDPDPAAPVTDPVPEQVDSMPRTIMLPQLRGPLVTVVPPKLPTTQITTSPEQKTGPVVDPIPEKAGGQPKLASPEDIYQMMVDESKRMGVPVGLPKGFAGPEDVARQIDEFEGLAKEGEPARFWYEDSSKALLDYFGTKEQAADFLDLLAATALRQGVKDNTTMALRGAASYLRNPEKEEFFRAPGIQQATDLARELLYRKKDIWGPEMLKRSSFARDLGEEIHPEKWAEISKRLNTESTQDDRMRELFGFGGNAPTPKQYIYMDQVMREIGQRLGWRPKQVQAALWEVQEAQKKLAAAKPNKDGSPLPTLREMVAQNKFDYADAMDRSRGQLSYELVPGGSTGHLPELADNPDLMAEHARGLAELRASSGMEDRIRADIGAPVKRPMAGPGVYRDPATGETSISPGFQAEAALVEAQQSRGVYDDQGKPVLDAKGEKLREDIPENYGRVDSYARDLAETRLALEGLAHRQNSGGWTKPLDKVKAEDRDLGVIRLGRPITAEETRQLLDLLSSARDKDVVTKDENGKKVVTPGRLLAPDKITPIPTRDGVWIRNTSNKTNGERDWEIPNKDFQAALKQVVRPWLDALPDKNKLFFPSGSDGRLVENDWGGKEPNGEGYLARLTASGRPDLLRTARDLLALVEDYERDFAAKHGLTFRDHPARTLLDQLLGQEGGATPPQGEALGTAAD